MTDMAKSVIREFLMSLADFEPDHLVSFFSEAAVLVDGPRHIESRGAEAIGRELREQKSMDTSAVVDVKALVSDGRTVMVERVDNVTLGDAHFAMEIVGVFEVDATGKIERWSEYYDLKSVMDSLAAAGVPIGE